MAGRKLREQIRDRRHVPLDEQERVADLQHGRGVGDVLRGGAPVAPLAEAVGAQRHDLLHHAEHGIADPLRLQLELGEIDVLDLALPLDLLRGARRDDPEPRLDARQRRLDLEIIFGPRLVGEYPAHLRRAEDVLEDDRIEGRGGHGGTPSGGRSGYHTRRGPARVSLEFAFDGELCQDALKGRIGFGSDGLELPHGRGSHPGAR